MANVLRIYTDGACSGNPGPGGYAVVWAINGKLDVISGFETSTTNNRMELQAVSKALEFALMSISSGEYDSAMIYTDSSYVYNAISQNWLPVWVANDWKNKANAEVKNSDIWISIVKMLRDPDAGFVSFEKVKGHSTNQMNNAADVAAVAMRDKAVHQRIKEDPNYIPPKSYRRGKGYKQSLTYKIRKTRSKADLRDI